MNITFDQIRGPLERIIYIALTWAVSKGWIPVDQVAGLLTLILGVTAAFYGWWQNRPKAILQSAEATGKVAQIVTTDKSLASDPSLPKTVAQ